MLYPPSIDADMHRHVFREFNQDADRLANLGHDGRQWDYEGELAPMPYMRLYFDGNLSDRGCSGGWVLFGSTCPGPSDDNWTKIATMSFPIMADSITAGELEAAASAHLFLQELYRGRNAASIFLETWRPHAY